MASELVCNEDELMMVLRQLERFYASLESSFEQYEQIMENIPGEGLEDTAITSNILKLRSLAGQQRIQLMNTLSPLTNAVKNHITSLASVDNFDYPELSFADVISLLASFL